MAAGIPPAWHPYGYAGAALCGRLEGEETVEGGAPVGGTALPADVIAWAMRWNCAKSTAERGWSWREAKIAVTKYQFLQQLLALELRRTLFVGLLNIRQNRPNASAVRE